MAVPLSPDGDTGTEEMTGSSPSERSQQDAWSLDTPLQFTGLLSPGKQNWHMPHALGSQQSQGQTLMDAVVIETREWIPITCCAWYFMSSQPHCFPDSVMPYPQRHRRKRITELLKDGKHNKNNKNVTVCVVTVCPALGKAQNLSKILRVISWDRPCCCC